MQILMSEQLKGQVEFNKQPLEDNSLTAYFIFNDETLIGKAIQLSFQKNKDFSETYLDNIVIELAGDLKILKKVLNKDKLSAIELPSLDYSMKIKDSISYLLDGTNNYNQTLSINLEAKRG